MFDLMILFVVDVPAIIKGLIILLFAGGMIALACYIIARILGKFFPGFVEWAWIIWCIGGLVWLLILWVVLIGPLVG